MASKSSQKKIRLVKCPKCLKILQEDEDVPVYQCGGCSTILQAKKRNIAPNSAGETERAQASEPRNESETNNVSNSSGQDTVLQSSNHEFEETKNASMESVEKELGANEVQRQECSLDDEREDNSRLESEAAGSKVSSGSLSVVDHVVTPRENNSSLNAEISLVTSTVEEKQSKNAGFGASSGTLSVDHVVAARESNSLLLNAEISPGAKEKQSQNAGSGASSRSLSVDRVARESNSTVDAEISHQIGYPVNKTSSAYDGSESCSDEREDQLLNENEEWNALQKLRPGKFERQRYPVNYKEQGASSSSTYSDKKRNKITTYSEWHQYKSLQLEGPGRRRRHVTQQLRPNMPLYQPSYQSHDEFDRYSRAHSLQLPPYTRGMNHECVDYMFHNNTRGRGNHSYGSYSASPLRQMQQPEYYPRWSHEIISDVELQIHRLKERQQRIAKRHIHPTAGGAPFVNCYSCSENLQLPVDFLIFEKKHHLLRCGTCSTVLRFSLQSKTHLVPAVTESPSSSSVQNEELPVSRGSPLHRLMGYSTVSQVFKASQRPPSI